MKTTFLILFLAFIHNESYCQTSYTENTLTITKDSISPEASINDAAWVAGHWTGEAFGGIGEEIWSKPLAGAMMGSYRMVIEDTVQFYEFMLIREVGNSLVLQIKHFNRDLTGWEEKNESEEFVFVKKEDNRLYFDGFTFEKNGPDKITLYVVFKDEKSGTSNEYTFPYTRKTVLN